VANIGKAITDESLRKMAVKRLDTIWLHEHDVVEGLNKILEEYKGYSKHNIFMR
jgi:hypothetical protein